MRSRAVTPIPISPRTRTVLLLLGLAALILVFLLAPSLLPLLLGGAAISLLMSLPVRLLSRIVPRSAAILLVVLALVGLIILVVILLVPLLVQQLTQLIGALPELASGAAASARGLLDPLAERGLLPATPDEIIDSVQQGVSDGAEAWATSILKGLFGALTGVFGTFLQLFGTLFIAIYLLADIRRFEAAYLRGVPRKYRPDARALWEDLGVSLSRYLGGLLISLSIQGTLAMLFMTFLGVPYAFLLGLWTAVTGVLPYIGAFLGAIPAVIIALFISPLTALLAAVAYVVINQVEGNLLTPRIQGDAIKVHPLLVFLAVFIGGEIGGLLGAAFAVPILAVLRVLLGFFADRVTVQHSAPAAPLPVGEGTAAPADPPSPDSLGPSDAGRHVTRRAAPAEPGSESGIGYRE